MNVQPVQHLTISEYLALERETETRYEYHNGEVTAMAGGTIAHGLLCGNVFGELRTALRNKGKGCTPTTSEVKIHIQATNRILYPDAAVTCGQLEPSEAAAGAITNPTVIFEVLSKSTAGYDRGEKFYHYRQLDSLQEYVLLEQDKPQIELYRKQSGLWDISRISGLDSVLYLASLDVHLKLSELYQDIPLSGSFTLSE